MHFDFLAATAARQGVFSHAAPRTNAALAAFVGRNQILRVFVYARVAAAAPDTAGRPLFFQGGLRPPWPPAECVPVILQFQTDR